MMQAKQVRYMMLIMIVLVGMVVISGCQNTESSSAELNTNADQETLVDNEETSVDHNHVSEEEAALSENETVTEETPEQEATEPVQAEIESTPEVNSVDEETVVAEEAVEPSEQETVAEDKRGAETVTPESPETSETDTSVETSTPETNVDSAEQESATDDTTSINEEAIDTNMINLQVGNQTFTATLANNSSAQALKDILKQGPLTIAMRDYGNMEKVGDIGQKLPSNNQQITTEAGDLILYMGSAMVIYYDTNSWNFTRLGKINDVTQAELKEALGKGDVSVTFTLAE